MRNIEEMPIETGLERLMLNDSLPLEELKTEELDVGEDLT